MKFSRTADAFRMWRCEGPHCFAQKRPRTFASALQRVAAIEASKNPLSRDFRLSFDFRLLQQYLPIAEVVGWLLNHHRLRRSFFCKLDIRPSSPVAPSQLSGAGSGLGRPSNTSLWYK